MPGIPDAAQGAVQRMSSEGGGGLSGKLNVSNACFDPVSVTPRGTVTRDSGIARCQKNARRVMAHVNVMNSDSIRLEK